MWLIIDYSVRAPALRAEGDETDFYEHVEMMVDCENGYFTTIFRLSPLCVSWTIACNSTIFIHFQHGKLIFSLFHPFPPPIAVASSPLRSCSLSRNVADFSKITSEKQKSFLQWNDDSHVCSTATPRKCASFSRRWKCFSREPRENVFPSPALIALPKEHKHFPLASAKELHSLLEEKHITSPLHVMLAGEGRRRKDSTFQR